MLKPEDITALEQPLRAVNGTKGRVIGRTVLRCKAGNLTLHNSYLVSDQVNELVLGIDLLSAQGVTWSMPGKMITNREHVHPVQVQINSEAPRSCRKISFSRDTTVSDVRRRTMRLS